jgi:hypothetical protein
MATSNSIRVSPFRLRGNEALGAFRALTIRLLPIRHHLGQLDDATPGVLRIENADFDPPEKRIRRREHILFARQLQLALYAFESALTDRRPFMRQTNLR